MPVKIGKIFRQRWFQQLSEVSKLLYIYLATDPNLNSVGVLAPNMEVAALDINVSKKQIAEATKELVSKRFIRIKKYDEVYYFIIPAHFNTIPKSQSAVSRVHRDLSSLPEDLVSFLASIGITITSKIREFVKPTAQEVSNYALEQGHKIDGQEFIDYYERMSNQYSKKNIWVDGRGTEVMDWKAKLRRIWCKDDNKIKVVEGAPKGFESFHVVTKDGKHVYPDRWTVDGQPWSRSVGSDVLLKREYNKLIKNTNN